LDPGVGARIHGSRHLEAINLGAELGATNLDAELRIKICGSKLGATYPGAEVPIKE
jgi:hypothetical protein